MGKIWTGAEVGRPDWDRLPRTRKAAMAVGAKKYFTGKPCKHGHVKPRYVAGECTGCQAAYNEARYWREVVAPRCL